MDPTLQRRTSSLFFRPESTLGDEKALRASREQLVQDRLNAYREDLAEWFAILFKQNITSHNFIAELANGVKLCQLCKFIEDGEMDPARRIAQYASSVDRANYKSAPLKYNLRANLGSFKARDNVTLFLEWAKGLGVSKSVLFEANDLVVEDIKDVKEKNVLYSLMELGRVQHGVEPPKLVELERAMDVGSYFKNMSEADELGMEHDIQQLLRIMRLSHVVVSRDDNGEYMLGDLGPFRIAKLRDRLMVRMPNSWDTLEHVISIHAAALAADVPENTPTKLRERRNSVVGGSVDDTERRMSIASGLERRRSFIKGRRNSQANGDGEAVALLRMQVQNLEEQLQEVRSENDDLRAQQRDEDFKRQQAEAVVRELTEELEELKGLAPQLTAQEQTTARLEDALSEAQRRLRTAEAELAERTSELETARDQTKEQANAREDTLQARNRDLEAKLKQAQASLQEVQAVYRKQQGEYDKIVKKMEASNREHAEQIEHEHDAEIKELEDEIETQSKRNGQLQQEIAALRARAEGMERSTRDHDQALREHADTSAALEQEIARLKEALHEEQDAHRNTRDRLMGQFDKLQERLKQESDALAQLQRELAERDGQAQRSKHLDEQALASLRSELGQKDAALRRMEESAEEKLQRVRANHEQELQTLQTVVERQKARLSEFEANSSRADEAARQQRAQAEELQLAVTSLEQQLASARERLQGAEREADEATAALGELRDKNRSLLSDTTALKLQAEDAVAQLEAAQEQAEKAMRGRNELEVAQAQLEATLREKNAHIANLEAAAEHDKSLQERARSAQLESRLAPLQDEVVQLQTALELTRASHAAARKELRELHDRLMDADNAKAQLQLKLEQQDIKLLEKDQAIRDLEARADGEQNQRHLRREDLVHELELAREEIDATKQARHKDQEAFHTEMEELQAQLRRSMQQNNTLRQDLASVTGERLEAVQRRAAELEERLAAQREKYENDIKQLRLRCMTAERNESANRLERELMQKKLNDSMSSLDTMRGQRDGAHDVSSQTHAGAWPCFANLRPTDLSAAEKGAIVAHDARTAEALVLAAECHAEATAADEAVESARALYEEEQDAPAAQALADAQDRRTEATRNLHDAEATLREALKEALARLQAAEEAATAGTLAQQEAYDHQQREHELQQVHDLMVAQAAHARSERELRDQLNHAQAELEELEAQHQETDGDRQRLEEALHDLEEAHDEATRRATAFEDELRTADARAEAARAEADDLRSAELKHLLADVTPWFNKVLQLNLTPEEFLDALRDGILLCQLANTIDEVEEQARDYEDDHGLLAEVCVDEQGLDITPEVRGRDLMEVQYLEPVEPESEGALSNVNAFIEWARLMGCKQPDVFHPNDLVHGIDEERVLRGLQRVARRTRCMPLPVSVATERAPFQPEPPKRKKRTKKSTSAPVDEVDAKVAEVLNFVPQMKTKLRRVAKGKYQIDDDKRMLLMRVLSNKVMVRVGGGWEDLETYLTDRSRRANKQDYRQNAQRVVADIRQSTQGQTGLCSTRTTLPQSKSPRKGVKNDRQLLLRINSFRENDRPVERPFT